MKDIELEEVKALARAADKESKLEAVQRIARASGYSLTITRDYLQNVQTQIDSALKAVDDMLNTLENSKPLVEA